MEPPLLELLFRESAWAGSLVSPLGTLGNFLNWCPAVKSAENERP